MPTATHVNERVSFGDMQWISNRWNGHSEHNCWAGCATWPTYVPVHII